MTKFTVVTLGLIALALSIKGHVTIIISKEGPTEEWIDSQFEALVGDWMSDEDE